MLDSLKAAKDIGNKFNQELAQKDAFPLSKWFKNVSGPAKAACLIVALSGGLTGCNTVQFAANYTDLQQEARLIDSMSVSEISGFINERGVKPVPDDLKTMTVQELAGEIADKKAFPHDEPVKVENPFVPGQQIKVINGNDLSHQIDLIKDYGVNLGSMYVSAKGGTFMANKDLTFGTTQFGMNSFSDPDNPSVIVMGDNLFHNWDPGVKSAETSAFVIYHELAHGHMLQESAIFGFSHSFTDALFEGNLMSFIEAHADVTASIKTFKDFNLSPQQFLERLDNLEAYSDRDMLEKSNGDGTTEHKYRSQKALEVLKHIAKTDPEFLKNIGDTEIPIFAYKLIKQTGYDHNLSEVLLDKYENHGNEHRPSQDVDAVFIKDLATSFSDRELDDKVGELQGVWIQMKKNSYINAYQKSLNNAITDAGRTMSTDQLGDFVDLLESTSGNSDLSEIVERHIEINEKNSNPNMIELKLRSLSKDLNELAENQPNHDDLFKKRTEIVHDIKDRIAEIGGKLSEKDKYYDLAKGGAHGKTTSEIAHIVISEMTASNDLMPNYVSEAGSINIDTSGYLKKLQEKKNNVEYGLN